VVGAGLARGHHGHCERCPGSLPPRRSLRGVAEDQVRADAAIDPPTSTPSRRSPCRLRVGSTCGSWAARVARFPRAARWPKAAKTPRVELDSGQLNLQGTVLSFGAQGVALAAGPLALVQPGLHLSDQHPTPVLRAPDQVVLGRVDGLVRAPVGHAVQHGRWVHHGRGCAPSGALPPTAEAVGFPPHTPFQ